jgi:hypothetical protein
MRRQPGVSGQWDDVTREDQCRAYLRVLASWVPRRLRRFGRAVAGRGAIAHWRRAADTARGHSPDRAASETTGGHSPDRAASDPAGGHSPGSAASEAAGGHSPDGGASDTARGQSSDRANSHRPRRFYRQASGSDPPQSHFGPLAEPRRRLAGHEHLKWGLSELFPRTLRLDEHKQRGDRLSSRWPGRRDPTGPRRRLRRSAPGSRSGHGTSAWRARPA